jgi:hypothetical protein
VMELRFSFVISCFLLRPQTLGDLR